MDLLRSRPRSFVVAMEASAGILDPAFAEPTWRRTGLGEHLVVLRADPPFGCFNRLEPLESQSGNPTTCDQY